MRLQQKTSKTSVRAEREFGLLVGMMAILIGSWRLYRGHLGAVATFLLGAGSALVILGLIFPRALVLPNRWWMALAKTLSLITTPIILGIIFFLLFMPIGMIKKLFGWDPLRRRAPSAVSYWGAYNARQKDPNHFEKMY
ncbi:MAG TPA: SxtJ family membrane protein [Blastocatellia bacterium]|nr:SxtJ family membrane protein [Blastocatellia bacterium]